jgi:hypothetical protein
MKQKITELEINGDKYILASSIKQNNSLAQDTNGLKNVLIRSYASGVHFGLLKSQENTESGKNVVLLNSRRVYYWDGAATLSQLAMEGSTKPSNCKITMPVNEITIMNAIEIIPITEKALVCLNSIKEWKL